MNENAHDSTPSELLRRSLETLSVGAARPDAAASAHDVVNRIEQLVGDAVAHAELRAAELAGGLARAEVASLCGLVLGRLGDAPIVAKSGEALRVEILSIFGEALQQFSSADDADA